MKRMRLRTYPTHILDFTLKPLLRLFWEPFSRKNSHFWQWNIFLNDNLALISLSGDPRAPQLPGRWHRLMQANFLWKKTVVLKPRGYSGTFQAGYSFGNPGNRTNILCSIILHGRFAVIMGRGDMAFFAVSYPDGNPIPLLVAEETSKDRLEKDTILI